jgi:hypothetical protein
VQWGKQCTGCRKCLIEEAAPLTAPAPIPVVMLSGRGKAEPYNHVRRFAERSEAFGFTVCRGDRSYSDDQ